MGIIRSFLNLITTRKVNINASDSARNLAIAIGEVAVGRSYDLTANPTGSFRALNLDPQIKILSGAPAITQPLYGANLKVELNGTTGTAKTGGVFAINCYSLITGSGHTVDKNVGMSVLADCGANLAGTVVANNFGVEIFGIPSRGTTVITNSRSLVINCPAHGTNRIGLYIGAQNNSGGPSFSAAFQNDGNSLFVGLATFNGGIISNGIINSASVIAGLFRMPNLSTPATAAASGEQGQIRIDANYIYVCIATDVWKRTALATW